MMYNSGVLGATRPSEWHVRERLTVGVGPTANALASLR